eukprot:TRINITY_DN3010_c0_g1_i1.p1 TRINITY_DN3010_c0_g1~~TRINITY_DN3010_c0_g1_i1.p1  ORF type:complete len:559 (-),score=131.77 TRINITY_DN3010_c0_g1_i1:39-1715(-)
MQINSNLLTFLSIVLLLILVPGARGDYVDYFQQQPPLLQCPASPRLRRSWLDLSNTERLQFSQLLLKMKQTTITVRPSTTQPLYDFFVDIHNTNSAYIHGTSFFLPAHRYLLFLFESALRWMARKHGPSLPIPITDPCSIALPYWDWILDFENNTKDNYLPQNNSAIFTGSYLGPSPPLVGVSRYDISGSGFLSASSWTTVAATNNVPSPSYFTNSRYGTLTKSLKRLFSPSVVFVYGPTQVANYLLSLPLFASYSKWTDGPHNIPHRWLSFQMQTMWSPDDVFFWVHHTNLDRLWAIQQDCFGYENASASDLSNPSLYSAYDTTGRNLLTYSVDTPIPLYWRGTLDSLLIPAANFPTPRQVWSCGASAGNYGGMYVRYGRDALVQSLMASCPSKSWSWVNRGAGVKRNWGDDEEVMREGVGRFNKYLALGHKAEKALLEAAIEECKSTPPVEIDDELLQWMDHQGTEPEQYDRICDPSSRRFYCTSNGKRRFKNKCKSITNDLGEEQTTSFIGFFSRVSTALVAIAVLTVLVVLSLGIAIIKYITSTRQNNLDYHKF